jgi:signal transduction histidine kinase
VSAIPPGATAGASAARDDDLGLPEQWWARIGHDLRGPLGPMRMAVQLLRSGLAEEPERQEALQVLDRQIDRLLGEIDDVADLMRLRNGALPLRLRDADLNLVLDPIAGRAALLRVLAERGQALECLPADAEMPASFDATRLCALLEFVLRKAAQHAGAGATLRVALDAGTGRPALVVSGFDATLFDDAELAWVSGAPGADAGEATPRGVLVRETTHRAGIAIDALRAPPRLALRIPGSTSAQ